MAPSSQTVLEAAIENRTSGLTLARSAAFRAQLPQDGHVEFLGDRCTTTWARRSGRWWIS